MTKESLDPLGEALHFVRMSGTFYCRAELSAPWGLALSPTAGYLDFHVVTSGRCWLEVDGSREQLAPGDFALVPRGEGHRLSSEPCAAGRSIHDLQYEHTADRYVVIRHGGGESATTLICGAVRFDHPAAHHLIGLLPRMIHVRASTSPQTEWIESTLRLMAAEAQELRPGGETVITRLAYILVIQAIRSWIDQDPSSAQSGWLGALRDPQIGRAIALVHREPARSWTVASLANAVAMSRSAFAARFTELVGEPVMQYATRWRMHVARSWLEDEGLGLGELSVRMGYRSEAAFGRAFKRYIGASPGVVRRQGAAPNRSPILVRPRPWTTDHPTPATTPAHDVARGEVYALRAGEIERLTRDPARILR